MNPILQIDDIINRLQELRESIAEELGELSGTEQNAVFQLNFDSLPIYNQISWILDKSEPMHVSEIWKEYQQRKGRASRATLVATLGRNFRRTERGFYVNLPA